MKLRERLRRGAPVTYEDIDIGGQRSPGTRLQAPRYRGLRVLGKCKHCGMPLPIPGPIRQLWCAHCQGENKRSPELWGRVLQLADDRRSESSFEVGDTTIDVRHDPPPAELEHDRADAPEWLRAQVQQVRCVYGATREGSGEGPEPGVAPKAEPVVMSCPQCAGALQVTAESERTVTCQYCQSAVFLPDPLWQRLHPVRTAAWWYVELQGPSAEDERAELERKWKEDQIRAQPYGTGITPPPAAGRDYSWIMTALFLVCGAVGVAVAIYYLVFY